MSLFASAEILHRVAHWVHQGLMSHYCCCSEQFRGHVWICCSLTLNRAQPAVFWWEAEPWVNLKEPEQRSSTSSQCLTASRCFQTSLHWGDGLRTWSISSPGSLSFHKERWSGFNISSSQKKKIDWFHNSSGWWDNMRLFCWQHQVESSFAI